MTLITDSVGRVLGKRYRLLSAVGSGASAQVFLAQDVTLRRHVAVKVLQPGLAQDETFLGRFRAEARFVASLNHPNVLRVFDWGEDTDGPYLVLEYLGGGSLLDLLDSGARLDPAQAALLGAQAARGLAYAHARGLVHRDVKPANLLFDEEGRVRVADFGVARALAEAAWTEPGNVMVGTARYASPEQAQGRSLDGKADVYSLALVMFESVTGELPFCADTTVGTLMARLGRSLPKHRALGPLQEILEVAARPDPSTRPNAAQLAGRLESLVSSLPVASALPLVPRLPVLAPAPPPAPTSSGGAPTLVATGVMVQDAGKTVVPPVHSPNSGWPLSPTPGQVFDREALQSSRRRSPSFAKSRRGRWPWVLAALLLALIVAGGLLAAVKGQLFTPSHPVPELKGLSVPAADKLLAKDKFGLHKAGLVYSITVPSGEIVSQQPVRGHSMKEGNAVNVLLSKGVPSVSVPQPAGLNCAGAERLLAEAHLKATCPAAIDYSPTVASGNVINWSYNGKLNPTKAPYGSTILLAVSNGPAPVTIPDVSKGTYSQAATTLQGLGFKVTQSSENSSTIPSGEVVGTSPAAGSQAQPGSTVTVYVSTGAAMVTVPDVRGETLSQATAKLQAVGLAVGNVYDPSGSEVIDEQPRPGTTVTAGSPINLYLGNSINPGH